MVEKIDVYLSCFHTMRTLHIYLPNDYKSNKKKYPVIYMFDGHNLFYDEDATFGKSWGLKAYLDSQHADMIVIGLECNHEGNSRLEEFSPYHFVDSSAGTIQGHGQELMNWLVHELKPWVDKTFRTRKERKYTSIAGSSMGGLMSLFAILHHNDIFSKAGCLSSFLMPVMDQIERQLHTDILQDTRVFLSWGSDEYRSKQAFVYGSQRVLWIANTLTEKGAGVYTYLHVLGRHDETSWEQELPMLFSFLFSI